MLNVNINVYEFKKDSVYNIETYHLGVDFVPPSRSWALFIDDIL